jgi:RNA polymerase sigma-70 factor, ECF subfamily
VASVEPHNLAQLISRARQRDATALTQLLDVHSQRLLESIRAELGERVRQRLESQDVMQQVYLDALRDIDRFVDLGQDSFFRWLRRIAVNRICDVDRKAFQTTKRGGEIRQADIAPDNPMLRLLDELAGSRTSPGTAVDRADRYRMLAHALDQLGDDQREVVRLRYLTQLSVSETAAKMDRTERAVRSLCVRALIRLRELLGDAI